jgi:hypothetical protein
MKPAGYTTAQFAALIALGVLISAAMFLWERRAKK